MREPLPLKVAVPLGAAAGAAIGVIAASLYLGWAMGLDPDAFDMLLVAKLGRIEVHAEEIRHAYLGVGGLVLAGTALVAAALWQRRQAASPRPGPRRAARAGSHPWAASSRGASRSRA